MSSPNDLSNILVLTVLFYTSKNTTLRNSILVLGMLLYMLALAKKQWNGIKLSKRCNIWMWRHEYNSEATTYRQG